MKSLMLVLALASGVASARRWRSRRRVRLMGLRRRVGRKSHRNASTQRRRAGRLAINGQSSRFRRQSPEESGLSLPHSRSRTLAGGLPSSTSVGYGRRRQLLHVDREFKSKCVMGFAYWNPRLASQTKLVNPQTGNIEMVSFERLSVQTLTIRGEPTLAHGWLVQATKQRISFWSSAGTGRWGWPGC